MCGKRVTLKMFSMTGTRRNGERFILCGEHIVGYYGAVYRSER